MAKSTPIHHAIARGAHQVEPAGMRRGVLAVPPGLPRDQGPVGPPEHLAVTKGPEATAAEAPPALGNPHVRAGHPRSP